MNRILAAIFICAICWVGVYSVSAAQEDWLARGLSELRSRKYSDAIQSFNRALEINPSEARAYNGRGAVWHRLGTYERAIADYTRALELDPRYAGAYNNRGVAWYQLGDPRRAIADYDQALSISPDYASALSNRGAAFKKIGDYGRAIADLQAANRLRSSYEATNLLAWILAACPDPNFRNGPAAVEMAKKAVEIKPNTGSLSTLAAAYAEDGRFEDAVRTQSRVVRMLKEQKARDEELFEQEDRLDSYRRQIPLGRNYLAGYGLALQPPASRFTEATTGRVAASEPAKPEPEPARASKIEPPTAKPSAPVAPSKKTGPKRFFPYTIQIASFRSPKTAVKEASKIQDRGEPAFVSHIHLPQKGGDWYRLFFGHFETEDAASPVLEKLKAKNFRYARIVKMPFSLHIKNAKENGLSSKDKKRLSGMNLRPYRMPDSKDGDRRILVGAFSDEASCRKEAAFLKEKGVITEVVKR